MSVSATSARLFSTSRDGDSTTSQLKVFVKLHHLAPTVHSPFAAAKEVPCERVQCGPRHRDGWAQGTAARPGQVNAASCEVKAGRSPAGSCPGWLRAAHRRAGGGTSKRGGGYRNGSEGKIHCSSFQDMIPDAIAVLGPCLSQMWPSAV